MSSNIALMSSVRSGSLVGLGRIRLMIMLMQVIVEHLDVGRGKLSRRVVLGPWMDVLEVRVGRPHSHSKLFCTWEKILEKGLGWSGSL